MKKDICFVTHVSDDWYETVGADKLVKSAKYFHPEIPFIVYGSKDINRLFYSKSEINWNTLQPFISAELIDDYETVVHFDADSMILGKLDELLSVTSSKKYQVFGVRNNNDFDRAGKDHYITQDGVEVQKYLNAGLVGTNSKEFLEEWKSENIKKASRLPFQEQSVLNELALKYSTTILDPKDSDVFYGISGLYGIHTHWDSWYKINYNYDHKNFILDGKKVKVIHHAGGHNKHKLDFTHKFQHHVKEQLYEIIR